ncbi:complexed with Cdc5 protein Cwf4 [Schizosaccharomyces cryophilus OY26]|uniref:Complexed with Cdc5 protein Cwf4 n=1 Tax=Schizosaccharomyces cryophilus (strain OY26 / ATCC MYA-4695 / CBS 11777 / NBRC 106824 / NRRL Y48691) TaxID=653667 RepID=S9XJ64_SCHCR|nr:complexed with Cdc5 protein Cwf4 [Schizosaccharomyces cryophilus OY26]EPY53666.1 complexed with Cdc5 protein Cwf4 [Schizosaccharomyces cryophilus OY26]
MDPAIPRVKNKNPAPIQISAEQLLREAVERQDVAFVPPKVSIADLEELHEFQGRKRKGFEDAIRRNRLAMGHWMRYGQWELEQKEFARARSVFERALDVDPKYIPIWLKYIECEMKNRNINHARNLFDRAITFLPRVDKLWYKYVYMEEMLGNITGCRQVFERWLKWEPDEVAWMSYIRLERRYHENERARGIFERFVVVHPDVVNWLRWARFEEECGNAANVRSVYMAAMDALGHEFLTEKFFIAFAKFEIRQKEYERARTIFKYAIDFMPRSKSTELYKEYTHFEKQYGEQSGIESIVFDKRRLAYENELKDNPYDYDVWLDLIKLEEQTGNLDRIREMYEQGIAKVPEVKEKRAWCRYIYIWLNYVLFEEIDANDVERARNVYLQCLKIIPHKDFTFAKVWIMYAMFELRQQNIDAARKTLGRALGMCPKPKLFRGYIEYEDSIKQFDRCRILYEKWILYDPEACAPWLGYANLENKLGDTDRARALFELAITQPVLETPELVWKAYIDFEFEEMEYGRARSLYQRLLQAAPHVKVWISFANFEIAHLEDGDEDPPNDDTASPTAVVRARKVFEAAMTNLRQQGLKEERIGLLEAWKQFESMHGTEESRKYVDSQTPQVVKKRRRLENGLFEEYLDYVFPDTAVDQGDKMRKLLEKSRQWKEEMAKKQGTVN